MSRFWVVPFGATLFAALGMLFGACIAGCVLALSPADVDRQLSIERNSAWVYRSDAAPGDQLLNKQIYCLAWRTLTENGEDAGDAGIACVPEGGQ